MKWMSAIGSILVVSAFGVASSAYAQDGGLDVTMRVLDDVSDVDGVVLDLGGDVEGDREADERGDARADSRPDEDRRDGDGEREHDAVDDGDREERAEGGLEDHDEVREPPIEEEIPADGAGDAPADVPAEEGAV
jgi:hypothetical protein